MEDRLQKLMARAGIASRRKAEEIIAEGRVSVNGEVITEPGAKADPEKDHIKVDGKLIKFDTEFIYIVMNKPKGVVCTVTDPEGRPTVTEIIRGLTTRVYPVGRLDVNTEGLILLTNDGELTNKLISPKSKCPKTYLVKVTGIPDSKKLAHLESGITVEGTRYGRCKIELLSNKGNAWLKVTLTEGKNHQIKNMFAAVNHPVTKIKRVEFAFLNVRNLETGHYRVLEDEEVTRLKAGDYKAHQYFNPLYYLRDQGVEVDLKAKRKENKRKPYGAKPGASKWGRSSSSGNGSFRKDERTHRSNDGERHRDEHRGDFHRDDRQRDERRANYRRDDRQDDRRGDFRRDDRHDDRRGDFRRDDRRGDFRRDDRRGNDRRDDRHGNDRGGDFRRDDRRDDRHSNDRRGDFRRDDRRDDRRGNDRRDENSRFKSQRERGNDFGHRGEAGDRNTQRKSFRNDRPDRGPGSSEDRSQRQGSSRRDDSGSRGERRGFPDRSNRGERSSGGRSGSSHGERGGGGRSGSSHGERGGGGRSGSSHGERGGSGRAGTGKGPARGKSFSGGRPSSPRFTSGPKSGKGRGGGRGGNR